jgi:Bacterial protein of unknown function (DUF882)
MSIRIRSAARAFALGAALSLTLAAAAPSVAGVRLMSAAPARGDSTPAGSNGAMARFADALRGVSGQLFARFVSPGVKSPAVPVFAQLFGTASLSKPGMYPLASLARPFSFITMHAFSEKRGAKLGSYRLGFWPGEKRTVKSAAYANPNGFIEVTPANLNTPVSEHFRLGDFLTHDQPNVWPKYLVLDEKLVDKLELVWQELQKEGVTVKHMTVMSGFRTPWYNANGGSTGGRAEHSRHMYGDASDVFVDNTGSGRMSDLNHDGKVDWRDSKVIADAADRVGRAHPDLVGGEGVYAATSAHGPFCHIDVRGFAARWGL